MAMAACEANGGDEVFAFEVKMSGFSDRRRVRQGVRRRGGERARRGNYRC